MRRKNTFYCRDTLLRLKCSKSYGQSPIVPDNISVAPGICDVNDPSSLCHRLFQLGIHSRELPCLCKPAKKSKRCPTYTEPDAGPEGKKILSSYPETAKDPTIVTTATTSPLPMPPPESRVTSCRALPTSCTSDGGGR